MKWRDFRRTLALCDMILGRRFFQSWNLLNKAKPWKTEIFETSMERAANDHSRYKP